MFASLEVKSWEQAKEIFPETKDWVFRGQNNEAWLPESSLYRQVLRTGYPLKLIQNRERHILRDFQRFAHQYIRDTPSETAFLDWLALLQHYGGPTRLVDFTHSFYVAAFFATEKADSNSSIWAIERDALNSFLESHIKYDPHSYIDDINIANVNEFNKGFPKSTLPPAILPIEPQRMHERLWIQQGLFLAPTDPTKPFLENLASSLEIPIDFFKNPKNVNWSQALNEQLILPSRIKKINDKFRDVEIVSVVKIIISKHLHHDILKDLQRMNINAATLFPGLDGFARSMFYHLNTNQSNIDFLNNMTDFSDKPD